MHNQTSLVKKAVIALVVVLLSFSKQIGSFLVEENRYYMLWRSADGLALILNVVVLAALAVAISQALHALKWDWARRAYNHLFLLALALGILSLLPEGVLHPDPGSPRPEMALVAVVALVAFSLGYPRSRLVPYAANLCLVFSPLVLILFFQLLSASTWATDPEPRPNFQAVKADLPAPPGARPVFCFVFDEWSYLRATEDGEFLSSLVHLRELSAQSFTFRQVRSHSSQTKFSIPAIVYQTEQALHLGEGQTFWESGGNRIPTTDVPSVFADARAHGYYTALVGFYLPYRKMLGTQVDYCRSWGWYPKGEDLPKNMLVTALRNLQYMEEPLSLRKRQAIQAELESRHFADINHELLAESLWMMHECPPNTFAFFHWPLPHGPFVLNPDGTYRGPYTGRGGKFPSLHGTLEDYERNLLCLDTVVGRIVEQLKASGKYDEAVLLFTSDHGWRYDPDTDLATWKRNPSVRRIPFLIKMPGQKTRHLVDLPMKNNHVDPILRQVFRGDVTEQGLLRLLEELRDSPLLTGTEAILSRADQELRSER